MTARSTSRATAAGAGPTSARISPGLPPWGTVYTVEPSSFAAGTAYITVDLHQQDNYDPFVYKTTDFGKTWKNLSATIPKSRLSYAHCIKEDPARAGLLYLGTENGLYVSFNDGENWQPLQNNLPHAPVYGITVQKHFNDLVLATYGRGFWILDDITPLRELTPQVTSAPAYLFPPRPAYRYRGATPPAAASYDPADGQNPPFGADLNYYLGSAPSGDVQIAVLDAKGDNVRSLRGTANTGINRVEWDFRYAPSEEIRLLTPPIYGSWMRVPPSGRRAGGRMTLLASPGVYTVKLTVDGKEYTRKLTVLKDPHSAGTEAGIQAQFTFLESLRKDLNESADMINQVEFLRKQAEALKPRLSSEAAALDASLTGFEENLYQLRITGGQDGMRWPAELIEKLSHLASDLQDTDFPPTDQEIAVGRQLTERVRELQQQFRGLLSKDVAQFNDALKQRGIPPIRPVQGGS